MSEEIDIPGTELEIVGELTNEQMELAMGENRPKIDYSKEVFSYNAQRLWRDRPDIAKAAIKLLAEPREAMPYRRIMKRLHVSYHVLRQLELSCAEKIKEEKRSLGDLMLTVTEAYAEQALLTVGAAKGYNAVISAAVSVDKYLQLRGEATVKVEVTGKIDLNAKIDQAYEKIMAGFDKVKRAQVVEIPPPALEDKK